MRKMDEMMKPSEAFLWPGTKVCERLYVNPEGGGARLCWMVNTLVYLAVSLIVVRIFMA